MARKFKQGYFKPKYPDKYKGNIHNIVFRSSWELRMMGFLDMQQSVIEWANEEKAIPYYNPITKRVSRYFPDFILKIKNKKGDIVHKMIEVKPKAQTQPPQKTLKANKHYRYQLAMYVINMAKFKAADKYCKEHDMTFEIVTEDDLFSK